MFRQEEEAPTSAYYKYGKRLYITNMSFPFVGNYYCHHKDFPKDSPVGSDKVYLYVNGTYPNLQIYQYIAQIVKKR